MINYYGSRFIQDSIIFKKKYFESETIKSIGLELFELLEYFQNNHIIHRNVKPKNIVWGIIERNSFLFSELKLINFG